MTLLSHCSSRESSRPALHRVTIRSFKFDPDSLSIAAGDTVEWRNEDIVPHTATAASSHWNSQTVQPGDSWRTVLTISAPEPYGCQFHPTMKAKLLVR
jgi:plastocyanin